MVQEQDKHDRQGCNNRPQDLRDEQLVDLREATKRDRDAVGQGGDMFVQPLLHCTLGGDGAGRASQVRSDSDGSGRVTVLEGGVMPARFEGSDLSQRYPYAGDGGRHLQRGQFLGVKRVSTGSIKHYGHAVRAFVERRDSRSLGSLTKVEGEHRLGDAQTRRFVSVQVEGAML